MRTLPLRVAVVLTLAAVLAPASASAKPPGPPSQPKPQEAKEALRLFEQPGFAGIVAARDASVEEVSALAAEAEGLSPAAAVARVTGAAARSPAHRARDRGLPCRRVRHSSRHLPVPPLGFRADVLVLLLRRDDHLPREQHVGAGRRGVLGRQRARLEGRGGAGYSWVIVHHEADFSCATPWWYRLNDTLWMEAQFDSYGNAWLTRTS